MPPAGSSSTCSSPSTGLSPIRPELYLPDRFVSGSAVGAGFWLLIAAHLLTGAAGVAAWRANRDSDGEPERRRWRLLVPLLAVTASVGLLTAPVGSDNGFLLARAAFEGPWPALGGYLLLAAALPLAAALALAAPSESIARGMVLGLTAAAFGVAGPPVLAGLLRDDLHVTWGPVLVLAATAVIAGLAFTRLSETPRDTERDVQVPGIFWWRLTTGVLGLATAAAAVIGTFASQVAVTALNPGPPLRSAPPPKVPRGGSCSPPRSSSAFSPLARCFRGPRNWRGRCSGSPGPGSCWPAPPS